MGYYRIEHHELEPCRIGSLQPPSNSEMTFLVEWGQETTAPTAHPSLHDLAIFKMGAAFHGHFCEGILRFPIFGCLSGGRFVCDENFKK